MMNIARLRCATGYKDTAYNTHPHSDLRLVSVNLNKERNTMDVFYIIIHVCMHMNNCSTMCFSMYAPKDLSIDSDFRVKIYNQGIVYWSPAFKFYSHCEVHLKYFPVDTQNCSLHFMSWTYFTTEMVYEVERPTLNTNYYFPNGEWTVIYSNISTEQDEHIPSIYIVIFLKRQPIYYMWTMAFPCFVVTFTSCFVSLIPSGSTAKTQVGVSLLLSYTMLMLLVASVVPKGSEELPLIGRRSF